MNKDIQDAYDYDDPIDRPMIDEQRDEQECKHEETRYANDEQDITGNYCFNIAAHDCTVIICSDCKLTIKECLEVRDEQEQDKKCKGCDCINVFYSVAGCSFECFNNKLEIECSHPTECFCDLRTPSLYKNYIKNKDNNCDMCEHFTDEEHYQIHFCIECETNYIQEVCCMSGKRSIENYHPEGVSNE